MTRYRLFLPRYRVAALENLSLLTLNRGLP